MASKPVVKPEIRKFAENVESLGEFLDAERRQRPTTPTIRPDTLEVLENAEQLVQDAKMTIAEVTHKKKYPLDSRWLDELEDPADEEDLYIKNIVSQKLDEANGKEIPSEFCSTSQLNKFKLSQARKYQTGHEILLRREKEKEREREKEREKEKERNGTKKNVESLNNKNFEIKNCPQINIRNKLSMVSVEKHDIMPDVNKLLDYKNIKTYEFKHESCDEKIEEALTTIDAAVQTSLRDLSTNSFNEPICTDLPRSHLDLDQNNINQSNCPPPRVNEAQRKINDALPKKPRTFIDFLSQINHTQKIEEEIHSSPSKIPSGSYHIGITDFNDKESPCPADNYSSLTSNYFKNINLEHFELKSFEQKFSTLDERIKWIKKTMEELNNLQPRKDELEKVEKIQIDTDDDDADIFLKPRTISSSSSCVSSEIIHPPNRFSTPLIASDRVSPLPEGTRDLSHRGNSENNVKKNVQKHLACVSEPIVADSNIVTSEKTLWSWPNVKCQSTLKDKNSKKPGDTIFLSIDNNKNEKSLESSIYAFFESEDSLLTSTYEKSILPHLCISLENQEISEKSSSKNKKTKSTLRNKKSKVNEDKVDESACQQEIKPADLLDEINDNKISKCLEISGKTRSTNVTGESSVRDRTSYDVSGLHSESFTPGIGSSVDKKEVKTSPQQEIIAERSDKIEIIAAIDENKNKKIEDSVAELVVPVVKLTESNSRTRESSISGENKLSNLIDSCSLTLMKSKNQENNCEKNHGGVCVSSSSSSSSSSMTSSTSSSLSRKIHRINRKFMNEDFSEGELCLPSSSSYSLGEIRVPEHF